MRIKQRKEDKNLLFQFLQQMQIVKVRERRRCGLLRQHSTVRRPFVLGDKKTIKWGFGRNEVAPVSFGGTASKQKVMQMEDRAIEKKI